MSKGYTVIRLNPNKVIKRLGLHPGGKGQQYYQERIMHYMEPYLPRRERGSVVDSMKQGNEPQNARITMRGNHIRYLYFGKAMAGKPKKPIDKDLAYTKSPHPKAGPFWAKQVEQNDMDKIGQEMTSWVKERGRK